MFKKFQKPTVILKMLDKGQRVSMKLKNVNQQQAVIILYSFMVQLATTLKLDKRFLMNQMIKLDKDLVRQEKKKNKKK